MTRQVIKQFLRPLAEIAIVGVLGKGVPRRLRRNAGRLFANAALRELNGLPWRGKANKNVVDWIVKEYTGSSNPPAPEVPEVR